MEAEFSSIYSTFKFSSKLAIDQIFFTKRVGLLLWGRKKSVIRVNFKTISVKRGSIEKSWTRVNRFLIEV